LFFSDLKSFLVCDFQDFFLRVEKLLGFVSFKFSFLELKSSWSCESFRFVFPEVESFMFRELQVFFLRAGGSSVLLASGFLFN
jgi:hypothetical protein